MSAPGGRQRHDFGSTKRTNDIYANGEPGVVSPEGTIDRIIRVENGRAVPDSLDPELEDAIKTIAASQFEPSLLNGEGITAVYEVTFDCSG